MAGGLQRHYDYKKFYKSFAVGARPLAFSAFRRGMNLTGAETPRLLPRANGPRPRLDKKSRSGGVKLTLKRACLPEYQEAQCAFKDSMIH